MIVLFRHFSFTTLSVVINNDEIQVPDGTTLLQACEKLNIVIPRFCYHTGLSIAGNCRMCLVEVVGSPKLQASCAMPVLNNLRVLTDTTAVRKAREGIMEFLLANHPLDCPICDQGGECDLQDQAITYGSDHGRYNEYKRAVADKDFGPLIRTSMNRCIHCTRCVRFSSEIGNAGDLGTIGRGNEIQISKSSFYSTTFFSSRVLKDFMSTNIVCSELSGNLVDVCPVGALTSVSYAFSSRPWELRSIESIDVFDGVCNKIRFDTRGVGPGAILRVLPRTNNTCDSYFSFCVTSDLFTWITDKTRFSFDGLKVQRLTKPLLRSRFTHLLYAVNWAYLLSCFRRIYRLDGFTFNLPEVYLSNTLELETLLIAKDFFNSFWCSDNFTLFAQSSLGVRSEVKKIQTPWIFDFPETTPSNALTAKNNVHFDFGGRLDRFAAGDYVSRFDANLDVANCFVFIGVNPRVEANLINLYLRRKLLAVGKSLKIISISSFFDPTFFVDYAGHSTRSLLEFIEGRHILCRSFFFLSPIFIIGQSVWSRPDGSELCKLLQQMLDRLVAEKYFAGTISESDRFVNSRLCYLSASAGQVGSLCLGLSPISGSVWSRSTRNFVSSTVDFVANLIYVCNLAGTMFPKLLAQRRKDLALNYFLDSCYQEKKKSCGVLVYQGHHGDTLSEVADFILPGSAYTEKQGTFLNLDGKIGYTRVITQPPGQARADWRIFCALSDKLMSLDSLSPVVLRKRVAVGSKLSRFGITKTKSGFLCKNLPTLIFDSRVSTSMWFGRCITIFDGFYFFGNKLRFCSSNLFFCLSSVSETSTTMFGNCSELYGPVVSVRNDYFMRRFGEISSPQLVFLSPLYTLIDNFFITDVISRASANMAKCSMSQPLSLGCFFVSL
uniref:NADH dehydrogenase subunit 11 n=1 Tax=Goniomonas avonlea TaxID=1255295 RepID=A0A348G6M0_9CRYP|nr:NADH dehydrogenase subunit 11 [Goniomonas avonlea]